MINTVLFVCTANQCRSPIAEVILKRKVAERGNDLSPGRKAVSNSWIIRSAGTWAQSGQPAQQKMIEAAKEMGLDLSMHRSCKVEDVQPLSIFKLILTMEQGQKEALQLEFPEMADRILLLPELIDLSYDVADPIGKTMDHYRNTVQEIDGILHHGFEQIVRLSSK